MLEEFFAFLPQGFWDELVNTVPVILSLLFSMLMGFFIYYVYNRNFAGVVYNQTFSITVAAMTSLTTMITLAISSNIALSLGMVGALSIVRYRTAIKDPMDILFLFWAVAAGITIGANMHYLAVVGSLVVILILAFLNRRRGDRKMYIMLVHYSGEDMDDELRRIMHRMRYQIKTKTIRQDEVELAVEVVARKDNLAFLNQVRELPRVKDVTLVQYDGEYHV